MRFLESVSQVLEQFPYGIGQECADPVRGLASKIEFLSIKSIIEWCSSRLEFYRALAGYQPPALIERHLELGPENPEQCAKMLADLAESLRADATRSPLDQLINQRAAARRLRVEEIARMAE